MHPLKTLHPLGSKGGAFVLKLGLIFRKTDLFRQVGFLIEFTFAGGRNTVSQCEIYLDGEWIDLI